MLALLLGALSLFVAASAEAQTAPTVSVAAGDGRLTATFNTGGHPQTQVTRHRMRWRVKDTDPNTGGDQAGDWLPSSSGHEFESGLGASRTASVPPTSCTTCTALTNGTEYEVSMQLQWGGGWSGWSTPVSGTPQSPPLPTNTCVKTGLYPATGVVAAARGTPMISYHAESPDENAYGGWRIQIKAAADNWPARTNMDALPAGSVSDPDTNFDDPCDEGSVVAGLTPGASYDVRFYLIDNTLQPVSDSTTPVRVTMPQATRSTNANLSGLTAGSNTSSTGTFTDFSIGTFGATTTSYTASVANDQTHVKLTPTVADTGKATVTVAGNAVTSGTASDAIALNVGANAITVRVTAEDGTTMKDYTVTVTRAAQQTPATDATLSGLTASSATGPMATFNTLTLSPAFSALTTSYTASVPNTQTHVKLRPTASDSSATVTVNGTGVSSGSESGAIALNVGANPITVRVTNGANTRDYTVTITRQAEVQTTATVSLSASSNHVTESKYILVTATLSAPLATAVSIPLTVTKDTAEDGDYVVERRPRFSFPPNSTRSNVRISTRNDEDIEDETFTVSLGTLPRSVTAGTPSSLRIRILDNDRPGVENIQLWASPNPVPEGSPVTVRVSLYRDSRPTVLQHDVRIPVLMSRGTAEEGDHGTIESITIPRGNSSATGEIWTKRDADTEDERFWVGLGTLPSPWIDGDLWFAWVTISENAGRTSPGTGGGGGGGGGGTPPPAGDTPPPEEPQDPEQSDDCADNDRENLVRLYDAADGDNWLENENWNSEESLRQWHGVDTDDEENVVSLRLSDNGLSGEIPEELLSCFSELKELALWGNDDLSVEIPEDLLLAVERAALREIAEMLDLNPEWFEDYEDPFDFEDWHSGVTTDEDGRVVELDLPGEVPESVISQFKKLREIMTTTSGGGCALSPGDFSAFSLFFLTLVVFGVFGRKRAR